MEKKVRLLTVEVMFTKCVAKDECWNCKPTTAAGALWPFPMNIAWVAVTSGSVVSAVNSMIVEIINIVINKNISYIYLIMHDSRRNKIY